MAHRPGIVLAVLAADVFAAMTSEILPVGLLGPIGHALGASTAATGLLMTGYAVVVAVLSVPLTAVLAPLPQRAVVTVLLVAYSVAGVLFALSPVYWMALAARLVGGVAHAGFFSVVFTAATASGPRARTGRSTAIVSLGVTAGLALGLPLATTLGIAIGWRGAFVVVGLVLAALAVLTWLVLPPGRPAATGAPGRRPRPDRSLLMVGAGIAVLMLGHYSVYTYVSVLAERSGVPAAGLGPLLLAYGLASALGVGAAGILADRRPRATAAAGAALLAGCIAGVCLSGGAVWTFALLVVWGFAYGTLAPVLQTTALRAAPRAPSLAPAVANAAFNVGIAGGAAIGGEELAGGGTVALAGTAAALALASVVLLARRTGGRSAAEA